VTTGDTNTMKNGQRVRSKAWEAFLAVPDAQHHLSHAESGLRPRNRLPVETRLSPKLPDSIYGESSQIREGNFFSAPVRVSTPTEGVGSSAAKNRSKVTNQGCLPLETTRRIAARPHSQRRETSGRMPGGFSAMCFDVGFELGTDGAVYSVRSRSVNAEISMDGGKHA